jgi:hypothetical protein
MNMKWIFGTSAVIGLAILTLGLTLVFTGSPASESPDDTRELASALVTDGNGMSEGIQVHGDWVIEVRDPDGTLVEKREFENEFVGQDAIASTLASEKRIGPWFIELEREDGKWTIWEQGTVGAIGVSSSANLTVNTVGMHNTKQLVLQGEAVIKNQIEGLGASNGAITGVVTWNALCDGKDLVCDCTKNFAEGGCTHYPRSLTNKGLQPPIDIVEGQQVKVTVTITFS